MDRTEAKVLLLDCKPLLEKIRAEGQQLSLSTQDLLILQGYQQVFEAGLTEDKALRTEVGFSSSELAELSFLLAKLDRLNKSN